MRRISTISGILCLFAALAVTTPALAHRLRLFATVEGADITGYAFFVGSARAHGADLIFKNAAGTVVHRMQTDAEGAFRWTPDAPATFHIAASTGDGHVSETTIEASRFGVGDAPAQTAAASPNADATPAGVSNDEIARLIESRVDAAVERQIRPLLEAYDAAETRLRFNDIMGGIGMIVGLAGLALWATGRRRNPPDAKS